MNCPYCKHELVLALTPIGAEDQYTLEPVITRLDIHFDETVEENAARILSRDAAAPASAKPTDSSG